ncbi:glutamate racemase [Pseudenhygromyxa sp. WMMC2535]|uniref:glutamate racemase n=1 Tax=Pseudenhygromyxa sp. WMMC2535 TaxID=2712867 RepID=UPI0015575C2F|nr:glutamate racemase [Pseudenhygromyxa sp. WMMC2535]NVB42995.1 glutamate racemase [Pseudenhygromyxa sp. WMMC2535]
MRDSPIGVFDSGVGGLTVLAALRRALPRERLLYLGDTARLPYGTKGPETVRRYARQAAGQLVERGVKMLVIACNTASAVAVEHLREAFAPLPVIGVVEPGARAACAATQTGQVLVLGTEGTIAGGAYQRAIAALEPAVHVEGVPCSLFVALAEEGWIEGPVVEAVARRYLGLPAGAPSLAARAAAPGDLGPEPGAKSPLGGQAVDTIVLGCTHFPVLRPVLAEVCGPEIVLVDSAETTAVAVAGVLEAEGLLTARPERAPTPSFLATDSPARFARVGAVFLGEAIAAEAVELVDL